MVVCCIISNGYIAGRADSKPVLAPQTNGAGLEPAPTKKNMHILYYITSHGFGHAVRASAIINQIPADVMVTVYTTVPMDFFERELNRPWNYLPGEFDCGCIQVDSMNIDKAATLETYSKIALRNQTQLDAQVAFCRSNKVDLIVSDIVPFAFIVAQTAGIPSAAVTNFTWYDIYKPWEQEFPDYAPMIDQIRNSYSAATTLLALDAQCPMEYFPRQQPVGVVGKMGKNIRSQLEKMQCIRQGCHLAIIYPGSFGMHSMQWHELKNFSDWDFIGTYQLEGAPSNYHCIDAAAVSYHDLFATADLIVSKIGYGIFAGAVLHDTPLLYLPRDDFAEHQVLEAALLKRNLGYCLSPDDYYSARWYNVLRSAATRSKSCSTDKTGAAQCAQHLIKIITRKASL